MDHRRRFSTFVPGGHDPHSAILEAIEFALDFLPQSSLGERSRIKAAIIVEELVSNVLRHGADGKDISLWLALEDQAGALALMIEDDGKPFDPTNTESFTGPDPLTGGGIGIAIVDAWGEDFSYSRRDERNVLRVTVR